MISGRIVLSALALTLSLGSRLSAAPIPPPSAGDLAGAARDAARHFGDAPDTAPPLAADLSPALTPGDVLKAMRKVADWEIGRHQPYFGQDWTFGALYTGVMAAHRTIGEPKYHDAMRAMAEKFGWRLGGQPFNADNDCVGQTYLELYFQHGDPEMMEPTRVALDRVVAGGGSPFGQGQRRRGMGQGTPPGAPPVGVPPGGGARPANQPSRRILWWWCDALFMAPPAFARLYKATGDVKYLDFMNRQWWICSDLLYDKEEHLYFRDSSFLNRKEANGKKLFWSRGNGWVLGGLARVLPYLPADYPDRPKYVAQFKEMCARVAGIQGDDGLWRAGLLNPDAYVQPENSGSAFFVYALAWGINEGLLDRGIYQPVVEKGWKGLLQHIYADGRLGSIQQTGAAPARFKPTSSYNYGIGAFLLAGSEVHRLASGKNAGDAIVLPARGAARTLAGLSVTNDLDRARPDEVIELPLGDVLRRVGEGVATETLRVRDADSGQPLVTQVVDEKRASAPDGLLLVQMDLAPGQTRRLEVFAATAPAVFPSRVYGRFVPERKDDFAWENDRVAFRMYGPKLQSLKEIGSGIDAWGKRTSRLILNEWYGREAEAAKVGKEAVHTDAGTGLDAYKVGYGIFRGAGGTGIWRDDKLFVSDNYVTWQILEDGPIRLIFELTYAPWDAGGVSVSETKRISLDAGSRMNRLESTFYFPGGATLTAAAGIQEHTGFTRHAPGPDIISVWDPADRDAARQPQGMMATGMVLLPGSQPEFKEALGHALYLYPVKSGEPIAYYAGSGWSKYDMPDQAAWDSYLSDFAARLKSPVKVRWGS